MAPSSNAPDEAEFNPDAPAAADSGLFGLDCEPDQAQVHVLGVGFDATTSYRRGAAAGPAAILRASHQVDLFDLWTEKPYEAGIWMAELDPKVEAWNDEARKLADRSRSDAGNAADFERLAAIQEQLNHYVHDATERTLAAGKLPGLVGGDHSVPFGAIQACAERYPGMGILHVDAHADLREAYEGFTWSHASILYNVTERIEGLGPIVQAGIRDLCEAEHEIIRTSDRIHTLFDRDWALTKAHGMSLSKLVQRAIGVLPDEVYVTFDVDGLEPNLCPNTGTPVPGGFSWHEAMLWLDELVESGRRIVGFDLNEVAPDPSGREGIDEIVGARLLYRLIGYALASSPTS